MNAEYTPSQPTNHPALLADNTNSSQNWVLDSGASTHLTPNPYLLQKKETYYGFDNVMVGNGNALTIANTGGQGILPTSTGSHNTSKRSSIPQLSGSVWEACANLRKTPTSNCTAIGRAITNIAVSVKDILREMNELKPAATAAPSTNASPEAADSEDEEFGDDLSPDEIFIAQLATKAVSDLLSAFKEVIRFVSGLHQRSNDENMEHVNALERLLSCCKELGSQANELGASVYPPQEITVLKSTATKMYAAIEEIQKVAEIVGGLHESFVTSFEGLESSLKKMESGLCGTVISEMERLAL